MSYNHCSKQLHKYCENYDANKENPTRAIFESGKGPMFGHQISLKACYNEAKNGGNLENLTNDVE